MGYRLDIYNEDETVNYYGTKHYGYSFDCGHKLLDEESLQYPSYCYLLKLKKINGFEYWDYGCSPKIVLTAKEFKHFIKLYAKEWEEIQGMYMDRQNIRKLLDEPEIKELLKDKGNKIVSWC